MPLYACRSKNKENYSYNKFLKCKPITKYCFFESVRKKKADFCVKVYWTDKVARLSYYDLIYDLDYTLTISEDTLLLK